MRKKFIAGAAILALLMNAPQVSADDDVVIFGGEFEDEAALAPKKVEKPAVKKELPPPAVKPAQPKPESKKPQEKPPSEPEIVKPQEQPPAQIEQPTEGPPVEPLRSVDRPFARPTNIHGGQEQVEEPIVNSSPTNEAQPARRYFPAENSAPPSTGLRTLKQRFLKLAVDDTYTYYLDKKSVQWKKIPYLASEYMADVWVRMIERNPAALDNDMAAYGAENFRAEVALAREQGYQYSPEDLKVLRSQAYVLEHYYLRPKTNQIQFLCELEVFGRPQNAINERAYDYKNWENLVPGSIESVIYDATLKIIGKSKANERSHMTFIDMLDEYARIALN